MGALSLSLCCAAREPWDTIHFRVTLHYVMLLSGILLCCQRTLGFPPVLVLRILGVPLVLLCCLGYYPLLPENPGGFPSVSKLLCC